jgi:hypothetical protein
MILKSLSDPSINTQELQLKVLQTILPLVTNYPQLHGPVLASALLLCFKLQDSKVAVVSSSAVATFRQLVLHAFEKLQELIKSDPNQKSISIMREPQTDVQDLSENASSQKHTKEIEKDALLLFQDLCSLTAGEPGQFLKISSMHRNLGLELIEMVISHSFRLFEIVYDTHVVS